ncbi:hypothetical protein M1373_03010 [Candidatus Marsarchaeota archaeon]|nr:hypothetical protein [Candidatus Marsarchaeota archaeon]MCL5404709.1 hypothetical protein [Candidatus Marsarchaeota archaeon]
MSILKRKEPKQSEPKKEERGIAYSIAMREMAGEKNRLKKPEGTEDAKKEGCGRA